MNIIDQIRNYRFDGSGELIRGAEITVATAVILNLSTVTDWSNWHAWAAGVATAAIEALVAYAKGKLPVSRSPEPVAPAPHIADSPVTPKP